MRADNESFRVNNINGHVYISFDIETDQIDDVALGSLQHEVAEGIIPVQMDEDELMSVRYGVPDGYIKVEDIKESLKIEQVLGMYQFILKTLEDSEEWYLLPESFFFDSECVYISPDFRKVALMYRPEKHYVWETENFKEVLIALLEKCDESHGGTVQLQLYKYFYKPKFDLEDFKALIDKFLQDLKGRTDKKEFKPAPVAPSNNKINVEKVNAEKVKSMPAQPSADVTEITAEASNYLNTKVASKPEPEKVKTTIKPEPVKTAPVRKPEPVKEKIEEEEEDVPVRPTYHPTYNRSQLSQEEIEEMVKSIYGAKENEEAESEKEISKSAVSEEVESEGYYGHKDKRKNALFENVLGQKTTKSSAVISSGPRVEGPVLKAVGSHPRYNLPREIALKFEKGAFVIGRESKAGQSEGVDFKFGIEVTPISHVHAQIEFKDGNYYLKDLGSSNGTFLNGEKITPNKEYMIEEGDRIAFAIAFSSNSIEYIFAE